MIDELIKNLGGDKISKPEDYFCRALELIQSAYQQLNKSDYVERNGEKLENYITKVLVQKTITIMDDSDAITIHREVPIDTMTTIENIEPRIDISITTNNGFFKDIGYEIECKVLKDKTISNYVIKNGINSFIFDKYGTNRTLGAMIGYNFSKFTIPQVTKKINTKLLKEFSNETYRELESSPFCECSLNQYESEHIRSNDKNIKLIHLFLDYSNEKSEILL